MEDRVMLNNSQGKKQEVEDHRRNVKFYKNKTSVTACNDSLNAKTSNVNFVCVTCGKCVLNDKHDMCVLHSHNGVNSRTKMPMAVPVSSREPKRIVNQSVAKPLRRTVALESTSQKPRHTTRKLYEHVSKACSWWYPKFTPPGYKWKPKSQIGNVNPNISMPLGNASRTANTLKSMTPRHSNVSNTTLYSNSFVARRDNPIHRTVKFGNDQIEPILGYGDLVQGTVTIKRVYYVEGLNNNLFSVGQFCDADLEVAFRKSTCYIHDLNGNDLLIGSPKATSSQAWLWHHGLSHLNFDTINMLSKNDIVIGLPKLKFVKDHLCSSYETPEVLIDFLIIVQRGLHAQVRIVRTDKGTKFLNKTLHVYFASEGIHHQTDGENLDKMKEKGDACIFIGYSTQSRAYRVFNKRTRVIVETIHVNFDELPHMASDHVSSDPVSQCQRTAHEHNNLSPGPQCQENVPHAAGTVTMSNELDLVFSPMFDELLNGSTQVVSKSSAVTTADAPNQFRTRHQLESDGKMCMFALTVSRTKSKNIKEAMADFAWIESMQEELHQFDRLDHMTGNLKLLSNFVEKFLGTVKFGNDQIAKIMGYGNLVQGSISIKRVYYVEGLNHNLFSADQLCDADLEVAFRKSTCYIRDLKGNDLLTATSSQAWLWHHRLFHLNFDTINLLSKNDIVTGLPKLKFVKDHLCSSCELGKAKRKSFQSKTTPSSKRRLQLLHMDLCGPMQVESINRRKYVLVIVDDYSRYTWTHFLRSKDETPEVLINFLRLVQRGLHAQVRTVRTDKGMEFLNKTLHAYFAAKGINHQTSVARTTKQNGVVERRNRTLVEAARTMLSATKVPLYFRAEAIATTCFIQNRSIVIPRHEKTPYHIINDRKPSVKFFYIFGSLCYIVIDGEDLDKMKEKAGIVTTSNELDLLFSPMFDELLNGSTQVVSKSSTATTADAPNQCQQQHTTSLNTQTTHEPTYQDPTQAPTITSTKNITQAEMITENAQVKDEEFINIFCTLRDMCVLKSRDGVNSRTKMPIVVPVSTREPKRNVNKSGAKPLKRTDASESTNQKPRHTTRKLYEHLIEIILFIVDSGCSKHMTGNLKLLSNFVEKFLGTVKFGNDQITPIMGYGDLVQGSITIKRVYYVEGLNHNLFSAGQLCDADLEVAFRKSTCYIRDLKGNDLLTGSRGTDLYSISLQDTTSPNPICLMAKATSSQAWLWHHRLFLLNFDTINLLSKNDIVTGLPKLKFVKDHLCSSCELGKAKRMSFQSKTTPSSKRRLQLLHMDLCGPMQVESINGRKYVLVIVDDYSRYTWTHFLRSKDETPEVLINFLRLVQRGLHAQVRTVRTDKGMEFLNKTLHAYFAAEGINHQTSVARTTKQNGVIERRNRTLVEAARTMLSATKVLLYFWAEAIATVCFTQNRSIVIPRHEKTPYHIINDRKPSVKFFYIFGSLCYIVRDGENLDKMKEK
nr:retrovirus-related Pol polyprotein from transposon TNT 1-94 [Tanacetum cinerariifolium]